jgi:hypothetical protein
MSSKEVLKIQGKMTESLVLDKTIKKLKCKN